MKFKKFIGMAVSAFLLLSFLAAVIPLDFFHDHTLQNTCTAKDKHSTCNHKLHISKKIAHCFLCNAHFDKNFIIRPAVEDHIEQYVVELIFDKEIVAYTIKVPFSFLRGPPVF